MSEFTLLCLHLALLYRIIRHKSFMRHILSLLRLVALSIWHMINTIQIKGLSKLSTDSGLTSSWLFKGEEKTIWLATNAFKTSQFPFIQCLRRSFPYHITGLLEQLPWWQQKHCETKRFGHFRFQTKWRTEPSHKFPTKRRNSGYYLYVYSEAWGSVVVKALRY